MRLLIGSDEPVALGAKADVRAWTQRLLWFAEEGDSIVLMDAPDPIFLDHVAGLTGVDPKRLRFHVMPSRWTGGNFDAWSLLDNAFQDAVAADAAAATAVVALWPSPEVAWLAGSLDAEHKLPGAGFWREGGGVLANSKIVFRALAGGTGVPVPLGGVCRTSEDAFRLSGHLLHEGHGFVVKREYGGGGAGNEIVSTRHLCVSHAGHASAEVIEPTPKGLHTYWERRWRWASSDGVHPVVVEAFVPDARTLYVELSCRDDGVGVGMIGELRFKDGRIAREMFPAADVPDSVRAQLQHEAARLGRTYLAAGYRGRLSLDSVVTADGRIFFTEANARFTTSTHLYEPIAQKVARVADTPGRVIVQFLSPKSWQIRGLETFLSTLARHGFAFDPSSRRGVLAVTPLIQGSGELMLAAVAEDAAAADDLIESVDRAFVKSNARARCS